MKSWSAEQRCHELLDALGVHGPGFDESAFVSAVGRLAGGTVTVARIPQAQWKPLQVAMQGHVSGLTTSYPGGWAILLPETPLAVESTVFGHEGAHILFGDTPHWDRCTRETREGTIRDLDGDLGDPGPLLMRSALRTRTDSRREARAERFGALLTARLEGAAGPIPEDRLDRFFQVGDV
ncbi:hypothetical protein ICW40_07375 [Actinotalea ferrariae]|uniref:hypothetical protein n=1 Tax=Actinotalea ferrariae TaxID=1386098 RepID=UPI001C8BDECA|nr:hypothetical protein [Actinotalea ferrariae]MBX9244629.1 hypothetical protein [Actinotalea ferrariae]